MVCFGTDSNCCKCCDGTAAVQKAAAPRCNLRALQKGTSSYLNSRICDVLNINSSKIVDWGYLFHCKALVELQTIQILLPFYKVIRLRGPDTRQV
jgi:hypothetical protein